ncbi:MAG: hypothetical protein RLZZ607_555 [Pseudomonadota bacterium]|jgi:hypothetical protein
MRHRVETTKLQEIENPHHTSSGSEDVFHYTAQWWQKIEPKPVQHLATHARRRQPVSMIRLKPLPDDVAILDQSHVFRGARLILGYVAEHGAIPLTPSKAFKRIFVNWAAEAFVGRIGRWWTSTASTRC